MSRQLHMPDEGELLVPPTELLLQRPRPVTQFRLEPQEGSQEFFVGIEDCFEVLYEGTRGPGKTAGLLMCFGARCGIGFGAAWRGIIFRKTYPELKDIIEKSQQFFKPVFGNAAKFNKSTHTWHWESGEELIFAQFERESDYWKYHGHEYPFIGWEELTTHADLTGYKRMMSCCRSARRIHPRVDRIMPLMIRATTNPYGVGHNVVKERFRLPQSRGEEFMAPIDESDPNSPTMSRLAIYGHISENKILLESDPLYINRVAAAAKNESEKKAWVSGSWDVTSGGMFDDIWKSTVHVIDPFDIPDNWIIDRSFDWGSSKPFSVGWWAESNGEDVQLKSGQVLSTRRGDMFRIREWYGWSGKPNEGLKLTAAEISKGIIERELGWGLHGRVRKGVADSAIFDVEDGNCVATNMAKTVQVNGKVYPGVRWEPCSKGKGSRKNGWETCRNRLKAAMPVEGKPREAAGVYIFRWCDQFLRTVPAISRDEKDPDDVDTDAEDHIADEWRYRMTWKRPVVGSGGRKGG